MNERLGGFRLPWGAPNPRALVNWWDMQKLHSEKFFNVISQITGLGTRMATGDFGEYISQEDRADVISKFVQVAATCRSIDLVVVPLLVEAHVYNFKNPGNLTRLQVSQIILDLGQTISSEMQSRLFLWIPADRTKYYDQPELFGSHVNESFQRAERDIRSAGTCYAADEGTACVMHLMRVLELGLNALAGKLGVRFERRGWENLINDIEAEVEKINGPHAGNDWREQQRFYAEAAKDFRYFKISWRNYAMHAHEHYAPSEARLILEHVGTFMNHLAKNGLSEPKLP
jgi:hypothetical protein